MGRFVLGGVGHLEIEPEDFGPGGDRVAERPWLGSLWHVVDGVADTGLCEFRHIG